MEASLLNRKNIIVLLILGILLLAIPLGLRLLQQQQILKSRAGGAPISFQGPNVSFLNDKQIFRLDDQGKPTVGLTLTSPFGPGNPTASTGNTTNLNDLTINTNTPVSSPVTNTISGSSQATNSPGTYAINLATKDLSIQADDFYLILAGVKYSGSSPGVTLTTKADHTIGHNGISFEITWPGKNARVIGGINIRDNKWSWDYLVTPINGEQVSRGIGYSATNVKGDLGSAYTAENLTITPPGAPATGISVNFKNPKIQPFF